MANDTLGADYQPFTIKDVARLAGVSTATVSRALNKESCIAPDTEAVVLDAAHKLGYRPNVEAMKLGRRNSGIPRKKRTEA